MISAISATRRMFVSGALATTSVALIAPARAEPPARPNPMPEELRAALERDPGTPVLGNAEGNITLTEFFDYNCPFCRKMVPILHDLISEDPDLRIVLHETPVFGEGSVFAAKASLAALRQKKYWQFHTALMAVNGKADETSARATAREVGLDETRFETDLESPDVLAQIDRSMQLADHLGLMGTPTFVAGDEGLFGYQSRADLQGLIARARTTLGVS